MGETTNIEKTPKANFYKGLKAEFKKVAWPDQGTITKQAAAVVSAGVVLGFVIAILDWIMKSGIDLFLFSR